MTTETEVFALFEEGKPVPDLDGLGSDALDAAAYIATLETRSSESDAAGYQTNRTKWRQAISNIGGWLGHAPMPTRTVSRVPSLVRRGTVEARPWHNRQL